VDPPTKTTSWIADLAKLASFKTDSTGPMHDLKKGKQSSSNLARVMVVVKSMASERASNSMVV